MEEAKRDEYGLIIPEEGSIAELFYILFRKHAEYLVMERQIEIKNFYNTKLLIHFCGLMENPLYIDTQSSTISKYIINEEYNSR